MQSKNKIYKLIKYVYILYITIHSNFIFPKVILTQINKNGMNNILKYPNYFYVISLFKKNVMFKNNNNLNKSVTKFALNTKKRHKEALAIRKYRMTGPSSIKKHYGFGAHKRINKVTMLPHKEIKLPIRRCAILGKMDNWNARKISKSGVRTHRIQRLNLINKRIFFEEENRFIKMKVSAKGLKTVKKYGLAYCIKKFNLDFSKKKYDAGYSSRRRKKKTQELNQNNNEDTNIPNENTQENVEEVDKIMDKLNLDDKKIHKDL
ncbi:50S ribosomal protein L28, apicoplast, putative [Plasmodium sp. gorilla clade G2]|uniref:50S ribosomal protein L28, apicoplast, putative n=1 Tax=Plasmodium sp. gorilla clade G2 TaxID=880535 RepID=UPI000D21A344|nr:50S ribosomal protein L28, apicoplast, putative [Plasmodium sp. gorilla clade G2]SOV11550.1 50S ribosomal protein L28, apicoplast, putative [Plasmodium sp. gorilla clade G2]